MQDKHYLALHGWNGTPRTFLPLRAALAVSPGMKTFLAPQILPADSLDAVVDRLEEQSRAVGHPLTVIGHCSGALLALLLAERRSACIERLCLIDAFAYWPWYFRIFLSEAIGRSAYYTAFGNPLGRWFADLSLAARRTRETSLTRGFAHTDHAANYRFLQLLGNIGSIDRFRCITTQVELVYGERTFDAVKESAAIFRKLLPQARAFELAGAAHLPIQEATLQLSRILSKETAI